MSLLNSPTRGGPADDGNVTCSVLRALRAQLQFIIEYPITAMSERQRGARTYPTDGTVLSGQCAKSMGTDTLDHLIELPCDS